jgi:hypothetical protein
MDTQTILRKTRILLPKRRFKGFVNNIISYEYLLELSIIIFGFVCLYDIKWFFFIAILKLLKLNMIKKTVYPTLYNFSDYLKLYLYTLLFIVFSTLYFSHNHP